MSPLYPYGGPSYPPPRPDVRPPPSLAPPVLARSDHRATAALVLGVLSMTCLGFLAGIPAIVLGAMSRKEIDRSQGGLSGRGIAAGGIVTGLFGTGLSLIVLVTLLSGAVESLDPPSPRTESPLRVPVAAGTRSYGSLDVVDLDTKSPLKGQITEIARASSAKNRTVMLQTYVRSSKECAEVAAALPDTRMQKALTNVTLIRVDIDAFEDELKDMRIETESAPWFYKLDSNSRVTDAISADEWDANVPENMAPVLADFARGALGSRRSPSPVGTAL
ncbi:hypothetical protein BH11MYX4_BH11MYX4_53750 [soil metagenome]